MTTFAYVKNEKPTAMPHIEQAEGRLEGRRCVIAGLAPNLAKGDAASVTNADTVESALFNAVASAGGEPTYMTMDNATSAASLADCDTLFICGQCSSLCKSDAQNVWRTNVTTTRNICEASEQAHVRRIVLLGSILSLGHSANHSVVDATTPYLADDKRTIFEKSLFRQEMEVWQMGERGMGVSVVCGGIAISPARMTSSGAKEETPRRWAQRLDPVRYAHLLSTPASLAEALVIAASDDNEGKRLICTGLSGTLADKLAERRKATNIPLTLRLKDMLGLSQSSVAQKILRRAGEYASDFAPAER